VTTITGSFRPAKPVVAAPPPPPARRERLARMLALAHRVEQLVEGGEVESYRVVARALGITPARMTQVMDMLRLSPAVQERVLFADRDVTARGVRCAVREAEWAGQEAPQRPRPASCARESI